MGIFNPKYLTARPGAHFVVVDDGAGTKIRGGGSAAPSLLAQEVIDAAIARGWHFAGHLHDGLAVYCDRRFAVATVLGDEVPKHAAVALKEYQPGGWHLVQVVADRRAVHTTDTVTVKCEDVTATDDIDLTDEVTAGTPVAA